MLAMRLLVGRLSTVGGACYDYLNRFFISSDRRGVTRALNRREKFTSRSVFACFAGFRNKAFPFFDIAKQYPCFESDR